uniref:Uncharacterized protein n=1 Tax=Nelumbo nucifera TaxID=4432 RepID=A0A822Y938_NELNU|nr:TPA_asm: hypothetical protein HUJ06_027576 [Nelumbo nucifera]
MIDIFLSHPSQQLVKTFSFSFQALDAKVIIFKKKRTKNYRQMKGGLPVDFMFLPLGSSTSFSVTDQAEKPKQVAA